MARKKRKQAKSVEEHTHLAITLDSYEARVNASVNHEVYRPQYAINLEENDPLYSFTTHLELVGTSTYPEKRAGDTYFLTLYCDDAPSREINATLKSVQARDSHYAPVYRTYRGKQVPVFDAPPGIGLLEKVRGEPRWQAWLNVAPRFVTDALVLLGQSRPVYLAIHERKEKRTRWIQGISVQTSDPAED